MLTLLPFALGTPADELHKQYKRSASNCALGHTGAVIVQLHQDSPEPHEYMATLKARARSGDEFHSHHAHVMRSVAVTVTQQSLNDIFEDEHTIAAHADCHVQRPPTVRHHVHELKISEHSVTSNEFDEGAGVEKKSLGSQGWNWGADRIDSVKGLDNRYTYGHATGKGTYLYTMDSGLFTGHNDFGGRAVGGYSAGCDGDQCDLGWLPNGVITEEVLNGPILPQFGTACDGHGTHTASTAAGRQYGVAKEASIIAVQTLNITGGASNKQVLKAADWVVQDRKRRGNPPSVMTLSLGGEYSDFLNEIGRSATNHGILMVAASGNAGKNSCVESPACEASVISVGAVDSNDHYAGFSNYGPCTTIWAPGEGITAAYPSKDSKDAVATESGTSMATPHVAGAALQLMQMNPKFTPEEVTRALLCMATKNVITGLDAHSHNLLLHTGLTLSDPHNVKLVQSQKMGAPIEGTEVGNAPSESTMTKAEEEEESAATRAAGVDAQSVQKRSVHEQRLAGGDLIGVVRSEDTNFDATRCQVDAEGKYGPSNGNVVPKDVHAKALAELREEQAELMGSVQGASTQTARKGQVTATTLQPM